MPYKQLKSIQPRNLTQQRYLECIEQNTVTIGLGPAGSGKTYLSVYEALLHHWAKDKKRMIITRPAIEAGEKLGFLPGDLTDKLDPYMRPIYDALYDLIGISLTKEKIDRGYIEIAPLAYMRGRTFNNCFIILDEAQNATLEQLKMVLTRVGENCKLVIDGDPGQSDLPGYKKQSGLYLLKDVLHDTPDVGIIEFDRNDIVRSQVVIDVVKAFEEYEKEHAPD
jgi:phosphate starvation-inducible PhoH-like protein